MRTVAILAIGAIALSMGPGRVSAMSEDPPDHRNLAINDPDQFAWQLFAAVNRPASPDSNQAVWETWAEQTVVYSDACEAPTWPGPDGPFAARPSSLVEFLKEHVEQRGVANDPFNALDGDQNVQQVKINRPFFNYVVENDIWYQQGLIEHASTEGVDLPLGAIVYKADWTQITADDKPRYHWRVVSGYDYEQAIGGGGASNSSSAGDGAEPSPVILGLYAFHIVSKATPNWVWTTWNHADTKGRCDYIGCRDDFGVEPSYVAPHRQMGKDYPAGELTSATRILLEDAGLPDAWRHYRLMGTMTRFTDLTGRPELLGNAILEPGFGNTSSCTTCHSMATIGASGSSLSFLKSTQPFEGFVGTPDPSWFFPSQSTAATPIVYQTDHMWQLPQEAGANVRYDCDGVCSSTACDSGGSGFETPTTGNAANASSAPRGAKGTIL